MNGYVKITVRGEPVDIYFGYSAHKAFIAAINDCRQQFVTEDLSLTDFGVTNMVLTAYESNCFNEKIKPVLKFDDFCEWLDEVAKTDEGKKELNAVIKEWVDSKYVKKMIEDGEKKSHLKKVEIPPQTDTISMPLNQSVSESSDGNLSTSTG